MRCAYVCIMILALAACGARDEAADSAVEETSQNASVVAQAPPAHGEVTDDKIGLPAYPGATEVVASRVKLHSDLGDTFSVAYQTSDSPTQVAAFYEGEAARLGTMKKPVATSDLLKSVAVDRADGSQSTVQAMTDRKGVTVITVHRFFPAKEPVPQREPALVR